MPFLEALSYVWGDSGITTPIRICNQPFEVTHNLYLALHYLQLNDSSRRLWIDAICLYFDQHRTEYLRNLRFGPLFLRGFILEVESI
jgi:hypothetical protein